MGWLRGPATTGMESGLPTGRLEGDSATPQIGPPNQLDWQKEQAMPVTAVQVGVCLYPGVYVRAC